MTGYLEAALMVRKRTASNVNYFLTFSPTENSITRLFSVG